MSAPHEQPASEGGVGTEEGRRARAAAEPRSDRSPWLWLLLVPLVMTLVPPIYNRQDPELLGFPFFYWWQFLAAVVAVLVTVLVYRRTEIER